MPRKTPPPSQIIGSIHDVQLPPPPPGDRVGKRPVSLQLCLRGAAGPTYEWFSVHRELRQRVYDLARHEKLPLGATCVFMVDETGAIVGFTVVR
jgi:hypothetical protein